MKINLSAENLHSDFLNKIEAMTKQRVFDCYQCGKCSAGCPIAFEMDYLPSVIIRMSQFGMEKEVLNSKTIWLCSSCNTCTTRCPREIDLAMLMDGFRILAMPRGIRSKVWTVPLLNRLFLGIIKKYGRLYELEMIGKFNFLSGRLFQDALKAPILFKQGRIKILPEKSNTEAVQKIFKNIEKKENRT